MPVSSAYRFPPELWTGALTGTMLIPLDTGSVYDTQVTLAQLTSFQVGTNLGQLFGTSILLGGTTPSVQASNKVIWNITAPTNLGGTDFFFRRDGSSLTGGSNLLNLFVNITQSVAASDNSQNWAFSSVISTANTLQRNAIAGDFQAVRTAGSGSLFALVCESRDQTGLSSAASGSPFGDVALELDVTGTGLDDAVNPASFGGFGIRNFLHFVAETWQGIVAPHEVAHGLWFGTSHGSYIDSVLAFDNGDGSGCQIRNAVDTRNAVTVSGSANPVSAVCMTAGHIIDYNGPTTVAGAPRNYAWYDTASSRWKYTINGVDKFSVDASGNARFAGTVTGSTTP